MPPGEPCISLSVDFFDLIGCIFGIIGLMSGGLLKDKSIGSNGSEYLILDPKSLYNSSRSFDLLMMGMMVVMGMMGVMVGMTRL